MKQEGWRMFFWVLLSLVEYLKRCLKKGSSHFWSKLIPALANRRKLRFKLGRQQWEGMLTGMKISLAAELDTTRIYKDGRIYYCDQPSIKLFLDEAGECLMIPTVSTLYIIIPMGCAWKGLGCHLNASHDLFHWVLGWYLKGARLLLLVWRMILGEQSFWPRELIEDIKHFRTAQDLRSVQGWKSQVRKLGMYIHILWIQDDLKMPKQDLKTIMCRGKMVVL